MAAIGKCLVRAGVPLEWCPEAPLDAAVTTSLKRWVESQWDGMQCIRLQCILKDDVFEAIGESREALHDHVDEEQLRKAFTEDAGVDPEALHVALVFDADGRNDIIVGPTIESLESLWPGLGWEALRAACAVGAGYDVFDFKWAAFTTEQTYWCGMASEMEWCSESEMPLSEYDGITRAQLEDYAPVGRMDSSKRLTRDELRSASKHADPRVATVAGLLLKLRALGDTKHAFSTSQLTWMCDWRDPVESTVLLGWKDFDALFRMGDDFAENVLGGGEAIRPLIGLAGVPLDADDALDQLARRWEVPLKQLRLADQLLWELGGKTAALEASAMGSPEQSTDMGASDE